MPKKLVFSALLIAFVCTLVYHALAATAGYDTTNFHADGRKWQPVPTDYGTPGKDNGPGTGTHNAGEDCGICHRPNGKAGAYLFTIAGTIYEDRAARKSLQGAEVILEDYNGNVLSMTTNEVGNFWTFAPLASNPCAVANHGGATTILYTLDADGKCVSNDPTGSDSRAWQYKAWVKHGNQVRHMVSIVPVGGATDSTSRMSCNMHHSPMGSSGGVWAMRKNTLPSYPAANLSFKKHILPIFRNKCVPCHIPGARMTRATTKTDMETPSTSVDYSSGNDFTSYDGSSYTAVVGGVATTITKQGIKDFVDATNPDSSPVLRKTLMQASGSPVIHAGGAFWTQIDADYKAIKQWIAEGALRN